MNEAPAKPPGSHFDVLILGPFTLYRDGTQIDTGWQRKVQVLCRILVTSTDRRRSRDELVEILWPETSSEAGFRNLRVVLHMLRRGLGAGEPSPILSEPGWVALNPAHEWDIDLERFESLAAGAGDDLTRLEEAAGYYRGEPLVEDRYEEWAIPVRRRVQQAWRELCLQLARLYLERGEAREALAWVDRVTESDPLDEEALRALLTILGQLGRRTEALRRFHQFERRLKDELDCQPTAETLAVIADVRDRAEATTSAEVFPLTTVPRPVPVIPRHDLAATGRLIGRETELGRILWTLPPMHVTAPRLMVVTGAAGIGKSRLLAEVAERARRTGILTLAGGAHEHEGQIPYGPIRDALSDYIEIQPEELIRSVLRGLLGDLVRILPELRYRFPDVQDAPLAIGEDYRLRLHLAVTKALERIAQDMPLILLLDDLQWSDASTLELLHFVVRQAGANRMLIVAAYRTEERELPVHRMVADMVEVGRAASLSLDPLPLPALTRILEERIRGRCSEALAADLHAQSAGNPLAALHLISRLREEGSLQLLGGEWDLAGLPGESLPA